MKLGIWEIEDILTPGPYIYLKSYKYEDVLSVSKFYKIDELKDLHKLLTIYLEENENKAKT